MYHVSVIERLESRLDKTNDCWVWTGAKTSGYGRIQVDGQVLYTHRVSYEIHVGPIPEGLHIDHLCRNRACCNPQHLEAVTCAENVRRGEGHGSKTHCPQGHPYEGDNLRLHTNPSGRVRRICRTCNNERSRRFYEQNRSRK